MAERRMMAKTITESDAFLSMPAEAQALYLHLNMAADDDGFVSNPRTVMRMCSSSDDSMKILIGRKFVLTFQKGDNFIVVIKHWRINNYIRKDAYRETKYKEYLRELYYDENQSYSLNPGDGHKPCLPEARNKTVTDTSHPCDEPVTDTSQERDEPLTQDRIGKESIGKVSLDKDSIEKGSAEEEAMTLGAEQTAGTDESFNHKYYREKISKCIGANDYEGAKKYQRMAAALGYEFDVP